MCSFNVKLFLILFGALDLSSFHCILESKFNYFLTLTIDRQEIAKIQTSSMRRPGQLSKINPLDDFKKNLDPMRPGHRGILPPPSEFFHLALETSVSKI